MHEARIKPTGRLIFGFVIIWLGTIFLLDEFGILNSSMILRYFWPSAFLAYGLLRLTGTMIRPHMVQGVVFTMLGGWMLLRALHVVPYGLRDFWPLILIGLGFAMVAGGLGRSRVNREPADADNFVSAFAMWSGVDRKVTSTDFRGGDLTAIMGGHDIDLRPAKMAGQSAVIELFIMMGGVDLRIPENWTVSVEAMPVMGAVEDRTRPPAGEVKGRLVLKGFVMMGGVEVKN